VRRDLDAVNRLLFTPHFPFKRCLNSPKPHMSLIGIGGNLGAVKRRFDQLFKRLQNDADIDLLESSPLLLNPDFADPKSPPFLNAALLVATTLPPPGLLRRLNYYERRFGRKRPYKNAPRTLDLDIIFFESKRLYNESLTIPHPHWSKRASVVVPMLWITGRFQGDR
jgi:2-amino-4-hydroxy-6-hydroxymethyldihydropteridine diphosphokinase